MCVCVFIPGSSREVVAPADISEQMIQKLRGKNEFTVLVTLKQDHLNSGVVLSIHQSERRFESNGVKDWHHTHHPDGRREGKPSKLSWMSAEMFNITVNKAERRICRHVTRNPSATRTPSS